MHRNLAVLLRTDGDAILEKNMQTTLGSFTHVTPAAERRTAQYLPIESVNKPNLTTAECAFYLNRQPQTLRGWACHENGPLRPTRIGGLLAWSTATVKALTGVSPATEGASK
jgi:hypothetical protein